MAFLFSFVVEFLNIQLENVVLFQSIERRNPNEAIVRQAINPNKNEVFLVIKGKQRKTTANPINKPRTIPRRNFIFIFIR